VLVLGLDGASFDLLTPLVASGVMPELGRLMAAGGHGELRSTFPPVTPTAWASFMTGKNPGKHGIMGFRGAPRGYAAGDFVNARHLRARTLWDLCGEHGLRVGAMSVAPAYPLRPVNGFIIGCMLTPPGATDIIQPRELQPLLGDDFEISREPPQQFLAADAQYRRLCLDYVHAIRRMGEKRLAAALRLMRARPCDLTTVVFYEPDRLQHRFWRHLVGVGPDGVDPAVRDEIAEAARAVYRDLDGAIGELVRAAGPDAVTFIVSDHGFGLPPTRLVHVNRWLASHGFLHLHRTTRLRRKLVRRLPDRLRRRYDTIENVYVSWRRSAAWCDPIETRSGGVWLNVRGRQPQGRIAPGSEYERVREEIRDGLADLRDGAQPVFGLVARREDVYRGPMTQLAPDLLLYTHPSHAVRFNGLRVELRARSPFADFAEYGFTGAHDPRGIYVAAGPGIAPLGRGPSRPIEALAPTILSLLGVPIPDGMDAEPMLDLLTPEARGATPVRRAPDADPAPLPADGDAASAEDQAQIEARLRALGYVE